MKANPFREFFVKTTDGNTLRVIHPDYAIISPIKDEVIVYDKTGEFEIVGIDHIVSLEPVKRPVAKKAKR